MRRRFPPEPEFLKHIEKARITAGGQTLTWSKHEETYNVSLPKALPKVIDGFCDLGVMKRGEQTFRLLYTARVQFEPSRARLNPKPGDLLRGSPRQERGPAPGRGRSASPAGPRPAPSSKRIPKTAIPVELKTDRKAASITRASPKDEPDCWSNGSRSRPASSTARPTARSAITRPSPSRPPAKRLSDAAASTAPFALMPEAVNSFGGAVLGDWLYVYSGHTGATHKYHNGTTTKHFRRLNLKDRRCLGRASVRARRFRASPWCAHGEQALPHRRHVGPSKAR